MATRRGRNRLGSSEDETPARELRTTVLVVDDEESFHEVIGRYLRPYRVLQAYNMWQANRVLQRHHVDVVLLDLNLPDGSGIDFLGQLRAEHGDVEVIVITAHSGLRNAVDATKAGAFDFMAKSYEAYQQVGAYIERALAHRRWRRDQAAAAAGKQWIADAFDALERSRVESVQDILTLARQVAGTPLTVLIEGESGVGKEILARYVHARSDRAGGPFRAVNLAAVPASLLESHLFGHVKGAFTGADGPHVGKFESAEGGTVFLDEIGELTPGAQVKLLRVLQEREVERLGAPEPTPVDVRVLAATNKDLEREVAEGRFREDLFYRLNVVRVRMPPLRERAEDIPDLADLFARKHALAMQRRPPTYSREAMEILLDYDWPGNVRELENLVMRLVALHPGRSIEAQDIPPEYALSTLNRRAATSLEGRRAGSGSQAKDKENRLYFLAREQFERYLVRLMVNRCGGNKKEAARSLGVSYSTVKDKTRTAWQDEPEE